jgi:basic membrane protein A
VESDFITLADYGPAVTDDVKQLIEEQKQAIISGELKIFAGPISDNQGNVKIPEGEAGGIELLDTTDWLVEGVIGQTN